MPAPPKASRFCVTMLSDPDDLCVFSFFVQLPLLLIPMILILCIHAVYNFQEQYYLSLVFTVFSPAIFDLCFIRYQKASCLTGIKKENCVVI